VESRNHSGPESDARPSPVQQFVVDARKIGVRFGGVQALNGVDLAVMPGERCGIIGPNGAGKTTLLDVLSGMRVPSAGQVRIDGANVTGRSPTQISRRGVRRTFQRHQPFGWLTVEENVLVALEWRGRSAGILADCCGLRNRGSRRAGHLRRVHDILEMCGLMDVRDRTAAALPIGQIRLLEIARALVDKPRALLLDEPTSGVGQEQTSRVGDVLVDIGQSTGCAILLVEHDIEFIFRFASRVMVLVGGEVLADGDPEQIRRDPTVIASYLGTETEGALK
jgi:branched-chain amino acid transport system ATP-binding protein